MGIGNEVWDKLYPMFGSYDTEKRPVWDWEIMLSFPTDLIPLEGVGLEVGYGWGPN